jgi:hypothetical protein
MLARIPIYGNDPILLMTCRPIIEKAGIRIFITLEFSDAVELMMNQNFDLVTFFARL